MEFLNAAGERVNFLNLSPDASSDFSHSHHHHQHHHHHHHQPYQQHQHHQHHQQHHGHRPRLVTRSNTSASSISSASVSTTSTARSTWTSATSTTALSPRTRRTDNASSGFSSPLPTLTPLLSRQHSSSSPPSSPSSSPPTPAPMPAHFAFDATEAPKGLSSATSTDSFYRSPADAYYLPGHAQQQHATPPPSQQQPPPPFPMRSDLLMDDSSFPSFPAAPSAPVAAFGYATDLIDPITPQSAATLSLPPPTPTDAATPATQKARKKYPCPHAQRFHCTDTFTTSGHAARHGKKHTGEKNVLCPTCHKAFTRKDNMKQHERTHRKEPAHPASHSATDADLSSAIPDRTLFPSLVASTSKSTTGSSDFEMDVDSNTLFDATSPLASSFAGGKPVDLDLSAAATTTTAHHLTNRKPLSSSSRLPFQRSSADGTYSAGLSIDVPLAEQARPNFDRKYTETSQDGEGESPGLDALAMVATGLA